MQEIVQRINALDWSAMTRALHEDGFAVIPPVLSASECHELIGCLKEGHFRKEVVMEKVHYGQGSYRYFDYPLPAVVTALRESLYAKLAPVANTWCERLRKAPCYPAELREYLKHCHAAGQTKPTPLVLRYGPGDYNRLHQDLYGSLSFPMQVVFLLNRPGADFEGGEFVLVEQHPRRQSRVEVVPLQLGSGAIFAVNHRPGEGSRGYHRRVLRHGVSRLRSGQRHTLGIIFHDAVK